MNCKVPWCVALVAPETDACIIHRKNPKWAPLPQAVVEGEWTFEFEERQCDVCFGSGTHQCDDDRCGVEHECGACDGDGDADVYLATNTTTGAVIEMDEDAFKHRFPGVDLATVQESGSPVPIQAQDYGPLLFKEE